jgi:hypothetical protein
VTENHLALSPKETGTCFNCSFAGCHCILFSPDYYKFVLSFCTISEFKCCNARCLHCIPRDSCEVEEFSPGKNNDEKMVKELCKHKIWFITHTYMEHVHIPLYFLHANTCTMNLERATA